MGKVIPFIRSSDNKVHDEQGLRGILESYLACTGWSRIENGNTVRFVTGGADGDNREIVLSTEPYADVNDFIDQSRRALQVLQSKENRPRFEIVMTMIVRHL